DLLLNGATEGGNWTSKELFWQRCTILNRMLLLNLHPSVGVCVCGWVCLLRKYQMSCPLWQLKVESAARLSQETTHTAPYWPACVLKYHPCMCVCVCVCVRVCVCMWEVLEWC